MQAVLEGVRPPQRLQESQEGEPLLLNANLCLWLFELHLCSEDGGGVGSISLLGGWVLRGVWPAPPLSSTMFTLGIEVSLRRTGRAWLSGEGGRQQNRSTLNFKPPLSCFAAASQPSTTQDLLPSSASLSRRGGSAHTCPALPRRPTPRKDPSSARSAKLCSAPPSPCSATCSSTTVSAGLRPDDGENSPPFYVNMTLKSHQIYTPNKRRTFN